MTHRTLEPPITDTLWHMPSLLVILALAFGLTVLFLWFEASDQRSEGIIIAWTFAAVGLSLFMRHQTSPQV
jgi:hypothetical protein